MFDGELTCHQLLVFLVSLTGATFQVYHVETHFVIRKNEDKLFMTHADVRAQRTELTFATQVRVPPTPLLAFLIEGSAHHYC